MLTRNANSSLTIYSSFNPPTSEATREVANLTDMVSVRLLQCVPLKKMVKWVYLDSVFRLKSNFQHKNSNPDLHHLQENMKFATQILPLLNYYIFLFLDLLCLREQL